MSQSQAVLIDRIRLDGGTQPRAALDFEVVEDYCQAMQAGARFPPVVVFYDGAEYWLADGFHRVKAAYAAGHDTIDCDVHQGTREEAQWHSFSANKTNGLRRTTRDKQRAVKAALLHANGAYLSDCQVARHVGVDQKTVTNWRSQLQASQEIPEMATRTATRRGKAYKQDTSNIGKRKGDTRRRSARREGGDTSPDDLGIQERLEAVVRAVWSINECGIPAPDLARELAPRQDRNEIITSMEKANEFLELCTTAARRAYASDTSNPPRRDELGKPHAHAGDAGTGQAVACA